MLRNKISKIFFPKTGFVFTLPVFFILLITNRMNLLKRSFIFYSGKKMNFLMIVAQALQLTL